ncbi:hypothetical protein Y88_3748 [Novosphingobium nitrogenifigens DSM 19370]|uniref:Uncharacterized protein n=1 Tax=Novosphingobium nitrogenifigens DSM 19370 TaxID=983920 RepID=F1ZDC0_9SPHN|nr:hypothetical protein Y88_3748 [Novosphingobium nitrogenifigens DSM 19370]
MLVKRHVPCVLCNANRSLACPRDCGAPPAFFLPGPCGAGSCAP